MWPLTDEENESYNHQKFCDICKKTFWDINDNDKKSNDRSNENDYDDENFDDRKVHCDAVEFDDIYDCYDHDDSNDDEFYIKKFHGDVTEINDNDKYDDYDDVKFVCIRFHSAS